jgi:hypothetical protein
MRDYSYKLQKIRDKIENLSEEQKDKIRNNVKLFNGEIPTDEQVNNVFNRIATAKLMDYEYNRRKQRITD